MYHQHYQLAQVKTYLNMKYIYNFKDKTDIIDSGILRRDSYGLFTSEIIELNKQFNYSVYLFGSYIGYLINGDKYNDIDFILKKL